MDDQVIVTGGGMAGLTAAGNGRAAGGFEPDAGGALVMTQTFPAMVTAYSCWDALRSARSFSSSGYSDVKTASLKLSFSRIFAA